MENYYERLRSVPVRDSFEKKGNLDYLAWAKAWDFIKMIYPDARYYHHDRKICDDNGNVLFILNYYDYPNGKGGFVRTTTEINGVSHTVDLAIMNNVMKSIPSEDISPRDVMDSQQRCFTKCLAMHGLGINAWTGEKDYISDKKLAELGKGGLSKATATEIYSAYELTKKQISFIKSKIKENE